MLCPILIYCFVAYFMFYVYLFKRRQTQSLYQPSFLVQQGRLGDYGFVYVLTNVYICKQFS